MDYKEHINDGLLAYNGDVIVIFVELSSVLDFNRDQLVSVFSLYKYISFEAGVVRN